MKNVFTIFLLCAGLISFAQTKHTAKDLFSEKSIVWYGIDYSKAKFIGSFSQFKDAGAVDGSALVNKYFDAWNNVIIHEPAKYDIAKAFKKESVLNDLKSVKKVNSATDPEGIMDENDYTLNEEELPKMVSKYKEGQKTEGIGVVFITESYNHNKETGSYYVVVFDIASKKILISKKYTAKPGGFGIKNYWISTARKTLEEVSEDQSKWKKEYSK